MMSGTHPSRTVLLASTCSIPGTSVLCIRSWHIRAVTTGVISRLHPFGLDLFLHLSMLVAHGRDFLFTEEYDRCLKLAEREYFVHLARCACARRRESQDFRGFHGKGLASINYCFDWKRLARWLPRAFVEKAWDAFWRRWDKNSYVIAEKVSGSKESRV
jgi:hypothetical protein